METENIVLDNSSNVLQQNNDKKRLPKRIFLVRHGESMGNTDEKIYETTPDHRIQLSSSGAEQARQAGSSILDVVSGSSADWKSYFYVSPYARTRSTLREIGREFPVNRVAGVREECRIREQDFGNFQNHERMKELKKVRDQFGRFFYRFPEGESGADVYDRVSSFLESLWRDIYMRRIPHEEADELNIVIVSHGIAIRIFLMKWFKWTVEQFESLKNPKNCEFRVLELGPSGDYSLAIQHDDQSLQRWGLSPQMIGDQKQRAQGTNGATIYRNEKSPAYLSNFFTELAPRDVQNGDQDAENK